MLQGALAKREYDWRGHSFTAHHWQAGQAKTFYRKYFLGNSSLAQAEPVIVWNDPAGRAAGKRPPYCVVSMGFLSRERGSSIGFSPGVRSPSPYEPAAELTSRQLYLQRDKNDRTY